MPPPPPSPAERRRKLIRFFAVTLLAMLANVLILLFAGDRGLDVPPYVARAFQEAVELAHARQVTDSGPSR